MANIQHWLEQIRRAIYGREVRSSIADAIEAINKEQSHLDGAFNQLIINAGNSNAEVVDARVKADGTQFNTLGERLNKNDADLLNLTNNFNDISREVIEARTDKKGFDHGWLKTRLDNMEDQIETKADKKLLDLLSFYRYGKIHLPNDFYNNIDFRIYRDKDGKIQHDFNLDDITSSWRVVYWSNDGADMNDGLTERTPKRSLNGVIALINTLPETSFIVKIISPIIDRYNSSIDVTNKIINKNIAFVSDSEANIGSIEQARNLVWVKNGDCYQTTLAATTDVWDKKNRDFAGKPIQYKKVNSLVECNNTKGSWYLDGNTLYVRRIDDLTIDADIMVLVQTGALMFDLQGDVKLIFKNINFLCTHATNPNVKVYSATNKGHLIGINSNFLGSQAMNGLQVENIKHSWMFDCGAVGTMRDGFNYHNYLGSGENSFAFEYGCVAYNNGIRDTNTNNNATTAHDGYRVLRIGDIGFNTNGPVLVDVNACYSINYDCTMYDSLLNGTPATKAAYYFDDSAVANRTTQAYLINCSGGGKQTFGINTDGVAKVNIHNFKGNNVNTEIINYLE